jgi:hypothetical protein
MHPLSGETTKRGPQVRGLLSWTWSVDYTCGPLSRTILADHSRGPIVKHRILEVCMIEFLTVRGKMCMSRVPSLSSWKLYTKCEVLNPFTI